MEAPAVVPALSDLSSDAHSLQGTGGRPGTPARVAQGRLKLLVAMVLAWALIYLLVYVQGRGNGSDFQVFYAGAYADAHGLNPFDWPQLWRAEQLLYNGGVGHGTPFAFAPYADPPPFALLLRPLTELAEATAYRLWALLLLAAGAGGAYLCLPGWPRRARLTASVLVALCPAALFDLRLGQNSTPLLLSLGLALSLSAARRPALAGVALSTGLLKPHLMIPVAVITILAMQREDRRAATIGFLAGGAIWAAIGMALDGGVAAYGHWLGSVRGFGDSVRHQPDLASIPGLYLGQASAGLAGALNVVCIASAALLVLWLAWMARTGEPRATSRLLGGGIAAYLAFSPYVHTSDQILLTLPLLLLIGSDGAGLRDMAVLLAAMACVLAPMVVLRDYHTVGINALPPLCVLLAYLMQPVGSRATNDVAPARALELHAHG